jgi:hypothetical protein
MARIPVLKKMRKDDCEFKANLGYIMRRSQNTNKMKKQLATKEYNSVRTIIMLSEMGMQLEVEVLPRNYADVSLFSNTSNNNNLDNHHNKIKWTFSNLGKLKASDDRIF